MKKIVFLLAVVLLIGGSAVAQKKNVALARAKLVEPIDTKAAKEAILLALKDSTTNKLSLTWFTAGEVFSAIYAEQQKLEWTQKKGDKAIKADAVKNALAYYVVADSLDQLPDKKGKVKPKFHDKIVEKIKGFQLGFTDAGSFFYEKKEYKKSLEMFSTYLRYPSIPAMKGLNLEKDTLIPLITYYCALSSTQAQDPATAVKYYELVKDSMDSKWIYARLSEDYALLKDTANMIRIYKLGTTKFPNEPYYVRNLINYYISMNRMSEALSWIEQAIVIEPKSAILWNVKGRIQENNKKLDDAKICFLKAVEFDPNFSDALGNIGRIYYNYAVGELDRVNAIRDDKKYRAEKVKIKSLFETPRPYFEKAFSINPQERDYVIALRGIYYNLDMAAKYQSMDKLLKEMNAKQ